MKFRRGKIKKKRTQLYCFNNKVRNAWDKYHPEDSIKQVRNLFLTFMAVLAEVETYVYQKTCLRTFTAALFIIASNWKLSDGLPTIEDINKLRCIYKMKCYKMRINKLLLHANT